MMWSNQNCNYNKKDDNNEDKVQSPLSSALSLLLHSKGLPKIQLVVDNAVAPCDELIDRALEYEYESSCWMVMDDEEQEGNNSRLSSYHEEEEIETTTNAMVDEVLSIVHEGGAGHLLQVRDDTREHCRVSFDGDAFSAIKGRGLARAHVRHRATIPAINRNNNRKPLLPFSGSVSSLPSSSSSCDDHKDARWEVSPTSTLQSPVRRLSATTTTAARHSSVGGTLDITHHTRDILSIEPEKDI